MIIPRNLVDSLNHLPNREQPFAALDWLFPEHGANRSPYNQAASGANDDSTGESDLSVQGKILGKGAVFAQGQITVGEGSNFATDNLVALCNKQGVSIRGGGLDSFFRGLIYTEGDFVANDITLLGYLAANTPDSGAPPKLELHDSAVVATQLPSIPIEAPVVKMKYFYYPASWHAPLRFSWFKPFAPH